jgi:inorganic pyrophosphatase
VYSDMVGFLYMTPQYTDATQFLGKSVTVLIDRPLGTKHPKYGYKYPINYGFIEGTISPDGRELDAYVLGVDEPVGDFTGHCIAFIRRINAPDDKLIIVPEGKTFSQEEIREATHFQEQFFQTEIIFPS